VAIKKFTFLKKDILKTSIYRLSEGSGKKHTYLMGMLDV